MRNYIGTNPPNLSRHCPKLRRHRKASMAECGKGFLKRKVDPTQDLSYRSVSFAQPVPPHRSMLPLRGPILTNITADSCAGGIKLEGAVSATVRGYMAIDTQTAFILAVELVLMQQTLCR
jgi:hypothetical protein